MSSVGDVSAGALASGSAFAAILGVCAGFAKTFSGFEREVAGNVSFTGGSVAVPSRMRRSESDNTATGVGCEEESEVVTGGSWSNSGR